MQKIQRSLLLFLAVTFIALLPHEALGSSVTIRTGVDGALTPLGENVTDPLWDISVQGGAFTDAEVVNSEVICCGMETAGAQAQWISDPSVTKGSIATNWGVGPTAIARRSFDLTGFDLSTTFLTGAWRVADNRLGVFVNGTLIPGTDSGVFGFGADQALAAGPASFIAGINVLELRGSSVNSIFDGFWLDVTIRDAGVAGPEVPEPGTLALLGLGLAGLKTARARRRRTAE